MRGSLIHLYALCVGRVPCEARVAFLHDGGEARIPAEGGIVDRLRGRVVGRVQSDGILGGAEGALGNLGVVVPAVVRQHAEARLGAFEVRRIVNLYLVEAEAARWEADFLARRDVARAVGFERERVGLGLRLLILRRLVERLALVGGIERALRVLQRDLELLDGRRAFLLGYAFDAVGTVVVHGVVGARVGFRLQGVVALLPRLDGFGGAFDSRLLPRLEHCPVLLLGELDYLLVGKAVQVAEGRAVALVHSHVAVAVERQDALDFHVLPDLLVAVVLHPHARLRERLRCGHGLARAAGGTARTLVRAAAPDQPEASHGYRANPEQLQYVPSRVLFHG